VRFKGGGNLGKFCGPILALLTLVSAVRSACAQLTATVLYPLTPPAGLLEAYPNIECDDTGQFVATVSKYGVFWAGNSSPVELNPSAGYSTTAEAVAGTQQVGQVNVEAALWTGSAATYTNLNPSGYFLSNALDTNGSQQVGYASTFAQYNLGIENAFLWKGSAASAVNLDPSGIQGSAALGTDGAQQVGYAYTGEYLNAFLWSGTAISYVNLHPSTFVASVADAVSNGQQVGYGSPPGTNLDLSLDASNVTPFFGMAPLPLLST
jgi:hypothetical protein